MLEVNDLPMCRNSLAAKGSGSTRLMSAYMRVEHATYLEPSIPCAATNDFRATKSPEIRFLRPLSFPIPLDFVVGAGAGIMHVVGDPLGNPDGACA